MPLTDEQRRKFLGAAPFAIFKGCGFKASPNRDRSFSRFTLNGQLSTVNFPCR